MALCSVRNHGEITIVMFPSQVDHVAASTLEKELRELVLREPKGILIDFSGTKYLSSSGIRVLLMVTRMTKASKIPFGVFALTKFVDHILSISGFENVLAIYDTEAAAVRAITKP